MNKPAAIYARVSSDRQKENHTIASQKAALIEYAQTNGYTVPPEWVFQDEGYSGAILVRPGLEALRDLAAEGQIAAVLIYSPDRLSRKYACQVLLSEELSRCGVELIFLKAPAGVTPEDGLLVQFQGMSAEYERARIAERCRDQKRSRNAHLIQDKAGHASSPVVRQEAHGATGRCERAFRSAVWLSLYKEERHLGGLL
jgi:site-specific DNA recombinase